MEVAECASSNANSCLNGGSCVTNANGIYVCACVDGKGGARCEKGKKDFEVVLCSVVGSGSLFCCITIILAFSRYMRN